MAWKIGKKESDALTEPGKVYVNTGFGPDFTGRIVKYTATKYFWPFVEVADRKKYKRPVLDATLSLASAKKAVEAWVKDKRPATGPDGATKKRRGRPPKKK